jgi:hypothetical protein
MRRPSFATAVLLLIALLACSHRHELSADERQHARDGEVASFANANGASVVPDIKNSGVTLDWQKAFRGPRKVFAFRGQLTTCSSGMISTSSRLAISTTSSFG